jgi:dipeptidyl aminopeptidase/acylaminoacyl peptidase
MKIFSKLFLATIMATIFYAASAQQPPLLDRDLFFGNPEISGGQLSPDGKYISFMKQYNGIMNLWVKAFDEPFEKARPLTNSSRPFYGYFWTRDSKYLLYVKDKDGDENMNIFAVDPQAPATGEGVPESKNLTPLKEVAAQIFMVSKKDPNILYVGLNDRDKAWHDLYELQISSGKLTKLYENTDRITGYDFDWDEKMRVMSKTDEKGNTTMFRVEKDKSLTPIYDFNVNEQAYIAGFTEDNSQCYLVTNKGELDKSTLFLFDPQTKKMTLMESDPNKKVDFGGLMIDDNTRKIIATSYTLDKTEYYWKDKGWEKTYKYLESKFPGREVYLQSFTKDYSKLLLAVSGDKYAAEVHFFDVKSKKLIHQYTPRPKLKAVEQHLAPMKPISFKSSDGMEIPAYLTTPVGIGEKNLPVIVLVHGGPKGPRDYWGYNAEVQFLANRGYAVLQPNFRSSGGYGKKFLNAGDMQWGKLMQDDITWGVKYLIDQGIADKNKVAIMGGSYGGYATLAGLAFTPDLYACGVDIVGPSNIFTLLESIPAYWESGRAFLYGMVGDPNTEEGKVAIKAASPLFSADKINRPLLIIQGANDPRVKKAEADQIVIALREKGKKVDYLLAADEGHGFIKPLNKKAMYAETEKFLAEILGGRYQAEMEADVKETLEKLRVDISTVKYEPKKETQSAAALPAVSNVWAAGSIDYAVTFEVQGQKMAMDMKRTIESGPTGWLVSDVMTGTMGQMKDAIVYQQDGKPVSREMEQMGQKISMTFEPSKAVVDMAGNKMEIAFTSAWMPDGPGADQIIARWPLKEGFVLVAEIPDMMTMKAKQVKISVTGKETLKTDECWMVVMASTENENDKTTYWINPKTMMADKSVSVMPAMGNAVMTIEKK